MTSKEKTYVSTKTYGHDVGLSCAFRQWRATSHCSKLHGYALSFRFEFESTDLNSNNWVVDFGGLKELKKKLEYWFDHTTVVATDDPLMDLFQPLTSNGVIQVRFLPKVGCEAFAEFASQLAINWLNENKLSDRVHVRSVEVKEHGSNSAIFFPASKG